MTDLVREVLRRPTSRSHALTPEMMVLLTLRYLATGKMVVERSERGRLFSLAIINGAGRCRWRGKKLNLAAPVCVFTNSKILLACAVNTCTVIS